MGQAEGGKDQGIYHVWVKSLIHFFLVTKTRKESGEYKMVDEIRMVYNAAKSSLNKVVYAP